MKALGRLFFLLLLLGNLTFMAAISLHFVQSPGKISLIPKGQMSLLETIVDTRSWTASDLRERSVVVSDISRAGKSELLSHIGGSTAVAPRDIPAAQPKGATPESDASQKNIFEIGK